MSSFLKNIQNTAYHFALWKRRDAFVVAVSGGPDSMCMLDCLVLLRKKYEWRLHVAHVNYSLRGEESDADEKLVRERADFYGIPLTVLHPEIPSDTGNLEARLRTIRYEFFETLRVQLGFDTIAVAHTQDDQAETVLLRLLRGAGLRGLGAMRFREGVVIRPFLFVTKSSILRYLEEKSLPFRIDQSNADSRFTRNRIRHELLPFLETFNPNIRATLARSALSLADDADALLTGFNQWEILSKSDEDGAFSLDVSAFGMLSASSQRAFLRAAIKEIGGVRECLPSFSVIEEILKFIASTKNKVSEKSFHGLKFTRKGAKVSVLLEKK